MIEKEIVSNFIMHKEKILLLKRSSVRKYGKSKWGVVSGFIERGEDPYQAAIREILEEISVKSKDLKLIKKSETIKTPEEKENILWVVHPFLFEIDSDKIKLDKEHEEYMWINPKEINKFDFVVGLDKDMKALGLLSG
jgi:ADP-ribose pyrophosphatase YjhB (NUDIX family)